MRSLSGLVAQNRVLYDSRRHPNPFGKLRAGSNPLHDGEERVLFETDSNGCPHESDVAGTRGLILMQTSPLRNRGRALAASSRPVPEANKTDRNGTKRNA